MGVEVNRHFYGLFQLPYNRGGTERVNQTGHVFKGYNLGAETLHLDSFFHKVFVGEYFFAYRSLFFFAE